MKDSYSLDADEAGLDTQYRAPGFETATVVFVPKAINTYKTEDLNITLGYANTMLPDGIYKLKYTINPTTQYFVEKTFLRTYLLQERFNTAFMKMDMMECDDAIKKQQKVEIDTIYYFIQGAIAAANRCAEKEAIKMYRQADKMLTQFITNKCKCNGNS